MFKPIGSAQIDRLNEVALRAAKKEPCGLGSLSTGEALYVALVSNRMDVLKKMGYTIPEALARIGPDWILAAVYCWQYAGNPAKYEPI